MNNKFTLLKSENYSGILDGFLSAIYNTFKRYLANYKYII